MHSCELAWVCIPFYYHGTSYLRITTLKNFVISNIIAHIFYIPNLLMQARCMCDGLLVADKICSLVT